MMCKRTKNNNKDMDCKAKNTTESVLETCSYYIWWHCPIRVTGVREALNRFKGLARIPAF